MVLKIPFIDVWSCMFLYQPVGGYCYNSDSIFLYDFAASFNPKGAMLEIGCGVGIIALLLSRDFALRTTLIDKQERMAAYAEHNFRLNTLEAKVCEGDFLEFESEERFDLIVSNPPFYDADVMRSADESLNIARYAHHLPFEDMVKKVKKILKPRGHFIFCYDAKQIDSVLTALKLHGINPEVIRFVHSKIDRESKLVMIAARAASRARTKIAPPLIVFDDKSNYLEEARGAFERAGTHSIKGEMDLDYFQKKNS